MVIIGKAVWKSIPVTRLVQSGEYDIYDYHNPDDTFKTNQFKVKLDGVIDTNWAQHYLNFDLTYTNKSRNRYNGINQYIQFETGTMLVIFTKIPTTGSQKKEI